MNKINSIQDIIDIIIAILSQISYLVFFILKKFIVFLLFELGNTFIILEYMGFDPNFDFFTETVFFFSFSLKLIIFLFIFYLASFTFVTNVVVEQLNKLYNYILNFFISFFFFKDNLFRKLHDGFFYHHFKLISFFNIKKMLLGSGLILIFIVIILISDLVLQDIFDLKCFFSRSKKIYQLTWIDYNINLNFNLNYVTFIFFLLSFYIWLHLILGIYSVLYDYLPKEAFLAFYTFFSLFYNLINIALISLYLL